MQEYEARPLLDARTVFPPMATDLPDRVDLSRYAPLAGHQGSQGSCAAWAVAYLKSIQEKLERDWSLDDRSHQMSPSFLYNSLNNGVDFGIHIHAALNLVQAVGVASLSMMPYVPSDYTTQPSRAAITEASQYKIDEWSRIELDEDWTEESKLILYYEAPIVVAMSLYSDFFVEPPRNPTYNSDHGSVVGYHAVLIVGYDDSVRAFKYLNSWGTDYGEEGYGWLTYSLAKRVVSQAYYAVDVVGGQPPPVSDTSPDFVGKSISDKTYTQGNPIAPVTLPTAIGGDGAVAYSLSGTVPPGLLLSGRTLRGTPTRAGTFHVTYTATDSDGDTDRLTFTVTVVGQDTAPVLPTISDKAYPTGNYLNETLPAATGGDGRLTYSLTPSIRELTFDAGSRTLYGTPREAGTYHMRYRVQDEDGDTDSQAFTIAVQAQVQDTAPVLPTISDKAYPTGNYMNETLPAASGGNGALSYNLTPSIRGLTFDAGSRTLYGTPREAGTYHMRYRVQDEDGDTDSQAFTIAVQAQVQDTAPVLPTISDKAYPTGNYMNETLPAASGGNGTLSYSLTPSIRGLTFDAGSRTLYGTPREAGTYHMRYRVQDEDGDTDSQAFTIAVQAQVQDTAPVLPKISDKAYPTGNYVNETLPAASGGNGALSYSLTPSIRGLTFDAGSRTLYGTPREAGTYHMRYRVQDEDGDTDSQAFTIAVQAQVQDTAPVLPKISDKAYPTGNYVNETLPAASGGNGALSYSLTPSIPGLMFDAGSRALYGTPSYSDRYYVSYLVRDEDGDTDVQSFTIFVHHTAPYFQSSPVSDLTFTKGTRITPLTLPVATNAHLVNETLSYSLTPSVPGLTFDTRTRTLRGTPRTAGTYHMTYRVEDDDGDTDSHAFVITVQEPSPPEPSRGEKRLYWTDSGTSIIWRANLDGTGAEPVVTGRVSSLGAGQLTTFGKKMYWTNLSQLHRANLDGTGVETIAEGEVYDSTYTDSGRKVLFRAWITGVAVSGSKVYWTGGVNSHDAVTRENLQMSYIHRANLDGSNVEEIVPDIGQCCFDQIAIAHGKMFWTGGRGRAYDNSYYTEIHRANLDGTKIETVVADILPWKSPSGIAISDHKVYWTDLEEIQRANLDGTRIETVLEGLPYPGGITVAEGKMYWSDYAVSGIGRIRRANLDGTGIETLVGHIQGGAVQVAIRPGR